MMKKYILGLLIAMLVLSASTLNAQQRHAYSDEKVEIDDDVFLPFWKGEIEKKVEGKFALFFQKVIEIMNEEPAINSPQGVKILFSGNDCTLDVWVMPYHFVHGEALADYGSRLSIAVNNPSMLVGMPVCSNGFYEPSEAGSFQENRTFFNGENETTALTKITSPLFVPMSRAEFLQNVIADEQKKEDDYQAPETNELLAQMEEAYQQLLKIDKTEAANFKKEMETIKKSTGNGNGSFNKVSNKLKKEQQSMSIDEKALQAFYSEAAMEQFNQLSGLVPVGKEKYGNAVIKINPTLQSACSSNMIRLITLKWELINGDSPTDFTGEPIGNNLADTILVKLYNNRVIWQQIYSLVEP